MSDFEVLETEAQPRGCGSKRDTGAIYMTVRLAKGGKPISEFFTDPFQLSDNTALHPDTMEMLVGQSNVGVKLFRKADQDNNLLSISVMDVVGKGYYTPASFLEEMKYLGPSRKISLEVAEVLADYIRARIPFKWHFVFRDILPEQEEWKWINNNIKHCPNHLQADLETLGENALCGRWLYEMEMPPASLGEERDGIEKSIPAGYIYTVYPAIGEYETPLSGIVCTIPGEYFRIESVVGSGEPNGSHAEKLGDLPCFNFVTE
jgi:hypothetical protein